MFQADEVNGAQPQKGYTRVTVRNKDSKESFEINFKDGVVKGNVAEWTIKDGKVYDKNGKTIEDNVMEVTRYQAALIKAAAGDDTLDEKDLNGANFEYAAKRELSIMGSRFTITTDGMNDATEGGIIYGRVVDEETGERGGITIDIRPEEARQKDAKRAEEEFKRQHPTGFKKWWNIFSQRWKI